MADGGHTVRQREADGSVGAGPQGARWQRSWCKQREALAVAAVEPSLHHPTTHLGGARWDAVAQGDPGLGQRLRQVYHVIRHIPQVDLAGAHSQLALQAQVGAAAATGVSMCGSRSGKR